MACRSVVRDPDKLHIQRLLEMYIECAEYLIEKCRALHHIKGAQKLERKCVAELKFLKSLNRKHVGFDECHLRSSNLSHYLGIIHAAEHLPDVTQILQAFRCPGRTESLHMDVVAGHGHLWVKVIARKGQALHLIWAGQGQYGERDVLLQAEDYAACATVYPVNFVCPTVVFVFYNGVTTQMAEALQKERVTVLGEVVDVSLDVEHKLTLLNVNNDQCSDSEEDDIDDYTCDFVNTGEILRKTEVKSQIAVRPDYRDIPKQAYQNVVFDVSQQSEGEMSKVDICSTQTNVIKVSADAKSNVCDSDHIQFQSNIDSHSRSRFIGHRLVDRKNNSYSFNKVSDIISEKFNKSALQVASNQDVCVINQEYDRNASRSDDITSAKSCTQVSNIDSPLTLIPRHFNQEKLTSNNSGNCVKTNNSGSLSCQQNPFLPGIGLVNKFDDKTHNLFDGNNWRCMSLEEFISTELLTSNTVEYTKLDEILAENNIQSIDTIGKINLDVSSLITLVSAVAHGRCNFRFQEPILSEQAAEERRDPVMPKLLKFMEGKKFYACQTAVSSFQAILDLLGGETECARAKDLMEKVTIVPDNPSFRTECLPNTGKIKDRSKIIFGTGDSLQAVTMTANSGFVRAAQHQGVLFAVYPHASRALTEQKEKTAENINTYNE